MTAPISRIRKNLQHIGPGFIKRRVLASLSDAKLRNISRDFSKVFAPSVARSPKHKALSYALRYSVFSEEMGYENQNAFLLEKDKFDEYALHCILEHRATNKVAGTIRLVSPQSEEQLLPMQLFYKEEYFSEALTPYDFRSELMVEVSRLAVPIEFRRANTKDTFRKQFAENKLTKYDKDCFPFIAIGLYFMAISVALSNNIRHAFMMVEPRLARSLKFIGLSLVQIGPVSEYFGVRAPYYLRVNTLPFKLRKGYYSLFSNIDSTLNYRYLEKQLANQIRGNRAKSSNHASGL